MVSDITVKCVKPVSFGLFSIERGSLWRINGFKHHTDAKKSIIRISELSERSSVWAEIPQEVFARCFDKCGEGDPA